MTKRKNDYPPGQIVEWPRRHTWKTQVNELVNGNRIVFYLDLSFSLVYILFYLFSCYLLMIKDRRSGTFCGEKDKIGDTEVLFMSRMKISG